MFNDIVWGILVHPATSLIGAVLFGALAMSGKFSLKIVSGLLVVAALIGLFGIWRSHGISITLEIIGSISLLLLLFVTGWWVHQPTKTIGLRVSDIEVIHLPRQPGEMLIAQAFFENVSGRTIAVRNIVWAQTRAIPITLPDEKTAENQLWAIVSDGLKIAGRDTEMPSAGNGLTNQHFESGGFGMEEFNSFVRGTHAVYFGAIMQDRKTRKNLIEMLFFVRNDGIVSFCSQHNKP